MANMNIKTEKILSPSNIKKIIMLGISLRDELENAEKGLISDYDSTQTYTRGQAVYYDNYLYKCLYTTTGTWDSTKWQKIGDELDLITKADIEAMLGLTQEEIASLQSLISTEIRLDKCFSSSDTYNRLLTVENECKKFTLEQLAKKAGVVYKVVADTTGVDSTEFLYLISNGSNGYNIYAYIDGSAVKISDTNINLDDYAKLSDLNNYYDKATIDGKYATITTVDGKVDKTSILSAISSNPSDDKLLSEKAIKSELDTINTNLDDKIDKASITTTIDSSSTDSEIATAKAVNDLLQTEGPGNLRIPLNEDLNNLIYNRTRVWMNSQTVEIATFTNMPSGRFTECAVIFIPYGNDTSDFGEQIFVGNNNRIFIRNKVQTTWTAWQKICTTSSVADVPYTKITLDTSIWDSGNVRYEVKNGICYVGIEGLTPKNKGVGIVISNSMPKPEIYVLETLSNLNTATVSINPIQARIAENSTTLVLHSNDNTGPVFGSFSYPVSES